MKATPLAQAIALAGVGACLTLPNLAHADFIADSKASLELRNFYMNRDFRQDGTPALPKVTGKTPAENRSKSEEWAQGFLLRYESGFTEGTVGVGMDTLGTDGGRAATGGTDHLAPIVMASAIGCASLSDCRRIQPSPRSRSM